MAMRLSTTEIWGIGALAWLAAGVADVPANSAEPVAAIAAGPAASPSTLQARPRLVLERPRHDFGKMETNSTGRKEFVLANRGEGPLVLRRGKSSCGCCTCVCDVRLPEQGLIPPGEADRVVLTWSIKQYTGDFRQSESLLTNDPQQPEITLEVLGRITPTVRVAPAQLVFTRIPAGEPAIGEVHLYGYRSEPLRVLGHELSDPATADSFKVTWRLLPASQVATEPGAQSGCLLRVEVKPSLAGRPFRQQILVKTNNDSAPEVEIPVEGTVGSQLAVAGFGWDPQTGVLTLGTVAMAKDTTRRLQVVAQAANVKPKLARVAPDLLEVEIGQGRPIGPVTLIPITIRIPPGNRPANYLGSKAGDLGQIVLQTGHPREPELRILVRFAVRPDPN